MTHPDTIAAYGYTPITSEEIRAARRQFEWLREQETAGYMQRLAECNRRYNRFVTDKDKAINAARRVDSNCMWCGAWLIHRGAEILPKDEGKVIQRGIRGPYLQLHAAASGKLIGVAFERRELVTDCRYSPPWELMCIECFREWELAALPTHFPRDFWGTP